MKFVLVLVSVLVYCCFATGDNNNCYRLGTVEESCHSDQIHLKVIRGPPGKPGAKGKDGQPCRTSQGQFNNLEKLASGLSQNVKDRSIVFSNILTNKIKSINKTIEQKLNSGSKSSNEGGEGYGGGNRAGLKGNEDVRFSVMLSTPSLKYKEAIKNRHAPVGVIMEYGVARYDTAYTPAKLPLARMLCAEKGGEVVYHNLKTLQQRKEFFRRMYGPGYRYSSFVHQMKITIGIYRKRGVWYYEDGTRVNRATFGKIPEVNRRRRGHQKRHDCAYFTYSGSVKTEYCRYISYRNFLICHYPLRISFDLPGKQTAFKTKLNFQEARKFCHKKDGRIALSSIKTHTKLRKLVKSVKIADGEYWIGVKKAGQSAWTYLFIDENVTTDESFPWLPNYPKFVRFADQCVVLSVNKSTVGMINRPCSTQRRVLCEFSS